MSDKHINSDSDDNKAADSKEEALELIREHRDLFQRLADSQLPISQDAKRGLAHLEEDGSD